MSNNNNGGIAKGCAFFALVLAVVIFALSWLLEGSKFFYIICMVKDVLLLVGIAVAAGDFVQNKKKGWKIVYWISLIVYLVFIVLGGFNILHIYK